MTVHHRDIDEIVNVPVPKRYLGAVYRTLAAEMGTGGHNSPPIASPVSTPVGKRAFPPEVPWTEPDLKRLREMIRTPTPRTVLDMTTAKLGERVMLEQIVEAAGRTRDQARADLGGFTQLVRRQFGRNNWPFEVEWLPGGRAAYFCDNAEIAAWWQQPSPAAVVQQPDTDGRAADET